MPLESTIEHVDDNIVVLRLNGALSAGSTLTVVDSQMRQLIEDGLTRLVIDVTGVTHADSSGLGFLMHTNGKISSQRGTMRLAGVGHRLHDLLAMTRVETLLHIDDAPAESIRRLNQI